jgi:hypothetical protein
MLSRQPLRFLLADNPGAGKTIMAGLLMKELIARGDLQRCLVVCPRSLAEEWQDELFRRFHLPFEILTNDKLESARTGNWFLENNLVIARLDKLSRNEDVQEKLRVPVCRWDLVVCDEAHKMSATYFGGEIFCIRQHRPLLFIHASRTSAQVQTLAFRRETSGRPPAGRPVSNPGRGQTRNHAADLCRLGTQHHRTQTGLHFKARGPAERLGGLPART